MNPTPITSNLACQSAARQLEERKPKIEIVPLREVGGESQSGRCFAQPATSSGDGISKIDGLQGLNDRVDTPESDQESGTTKGSLPLSSEFDWEAWREAMDRELSDRNLAYYLEHIHD